MKELEDFMNEKKDTDKFLEEIQGTPDKEDVSDHYDRMMKELEQKKEEPDDFDKTIAYGANKENKQKSHVPENRGRSKKPLVQLNSSISIKSNKKAMNTEEDNSQTRRE